MNKIVSSEDVGMCIEALTPDLGVPLALFCPTVHCLQSISEDDAPKDGILTQQPSPACDSPDVLNCSSHDPQTADVAGELWEL